MRKKKKETSKEEKELVKQWRRGDKEAYDLLHNLYIGKSGDGGRKGKLVYYCRRLLPNHVDANEVAEEVFNRIITTGHPSPSFPVP